PLLHNRSTSAQAFRSSLFTRLEVRAVLDLSANRRDVFSNAVAPTALLIAKPPTQRPDIDNPDESVGEEGSPAVPRRGILHIASHPRPLSAAAGVLTITPEEVRTVSSRQASARPDVWKAMLWGGPRDLELIDRLRASFPPVQEIAEKQGWTTGRGYQVSGGDEIDASHLNGLPDIPTTSVLPLRL